MPAQNPSQLHALVQAQIPDNNNNLIDPAEVRAVLDAMIDSCYNLIATPNPTAPSLENVLIEGNTSGAKDIVLSEGQQLRFNGFVNRVLLSIADTTESLGNLTVQLPSRNGTVALLDDVVSSWLAPVADEVDQPTGTEADGTRYIVGAGAVGAFTGHAGDIAEKSGSAWAFTATQDGDMVRALVDGDGVIRSKEGGVWITPADLGDVLSLALVLGVGNTSGAHDIQMDQGQAVSFGGATVGDILRLLPAAVTGAVNLTLPNTSGTLALLTDLLGIRLEDVLVAGNETAGRSIQVSEFDGVNFLQGANYVRMKAPATVVAARTLLLPDKSGTLATTDDVAAVVALIDGTMRSPEAFTPAGSYPTTFGGNAIEAGDSFRLAAGTMGARTVNAEDLAIALVDAPGQVDSNWQVIESNRTVATQAEAEDDASTDLAKLVPPQRWWQAWTKGLTRTAFGAAVRGTLLTGYAVGANAAIAATDSVLGALAKIQGQLNAIGISLDTLFLAKDSNLADVPDKTTARNNLGLKRYATQDYAEAVIGRGYQATDYGSPVMGQLVVTNAAGNVTPATPDNAAGQRLAMIVENVSGPARMQYGGVVAGILTGLVAGAAYYLDPATPGGITNVRPSANTIYIGTAINAGMLDFRPAMAVQSGSVMLTVDDPAVSAAAGATSGLVSANLVGGAVYEVKIYARTNTSFGAGRCRLWLNFLGTARGSEQIASDGADANTNYSYTVADMLVANPDASVITEGVDLEQQLTALLIVNGHYNGPVTIMTGPLNDTKEVTLKAGSTLTWNHIG